MMRGIVGEDRRRRGHQRLRRRNDSDRRWRGPWACRRPNAGKPNTPRTFTNSARQRVKEVGVEVASGQGALRGWRSRSSRSRSSAGRPSHPRA
jgi:hypothetical protein